MLRPTAEFDDVRRRVGRPVGFARTRQDVHSGFRLAQFAPGRRKTDACVFQMTLHGDPRGLGVALLDRFEDFAVLDDRAAPGLLGVVVFKIT